MAEVIFQRGDGSGFGYGGFGYGYGDVSGSTGYGDGYGSGYGSGDGSGFGYGGFDYGYGYGDGDGYGSGDGSGYGSVSYWSACLPILAAVAGCSKHLEESRQAGATIAYWCSDHEGLPANGGNSARPAAAGLVEETRGPLVLCESGTLHATHLPTKWRGDRWWIVALWGKVIGDGEKMGALKREIICECTIPAVSSLARSEGP